MKKVVIAISCLTLFSRQLVAGDFTITPLLDLRWRQEILDTLSANRALDNKYSYGNLRERFGGELGYKFLTLHMLGQVANSYNVPNNASFGAGASYYSLSGNDTSPGHAALAEATVIVRPNKEWMGAIGRQGIKDGAEPATGNARMDWVQENRISERLIGNWDWTNVGRRFDGVTGGYNSEAVAAAAYGARILQGGLAYDNAFEPLDGVQTAGLSVSLKKLLPKSKVRFFDILYRDYRPITNSTIGDSLYLNTMGADFVGVYPVGPGALDVLLWGAYQFGDYGRKTQSATAFLLEGGYGLPEKAWAPYFRTGVNFASGGAANAGTHTTFVNMAPTNHKFYGMQDLNAFQNLTDIFFLFAIQPVKPVKFEIQDHIFKLSTSRDAWYAGSGPASNSAFGIAPRPGAGTLGTNIGNEIDLIATWMPVKRLSIQGGYSHFEGSSAARAVYPVKSVTNFLYFQVAFKY